MRLREIDGEIEFDSQIDVGLDLMDSKLLNDPVAIIKNAIRDYEFKPILREQISDL